MARVSEMFNILHQFIAGFLRKGWKREVWWRWGWGLQFEEASCPEIATKSSRKHLHQPQTSSLNFPQEPWFIVEASEVVIDCNFLTRNRGLEYRFVLIHAISPKRVVNCLQLVCEKLVETLRTNSSQKVQARAIMNLREMLESPRCILPRSARRNLFNLAKDVRFRVSKRYFLSCVTFSSWNDEKELISCSSFFFPSSQRPTRITWSGASAWSFWPYWRWTTAKEGL
jgi:hypothetical protein